MSAADRGRRPYLTRVRVRTWKAGRSMTPGVALLKGRTVVAHLTGREALALADHLVDLVEAHGLADDDTPTPTPQEDTP